MQIKKRHLKKAELCLFENELKGACKVDDFIPKQRISFALHVLHPRAGLHGPCAPACCLLLPSCFDSKLSAEETPSPAAKRAFLLVGVCERLEQTGGRRCGEKKGETTCNDNYYPGVFFGSVQIEKRYIAV